MVFVTLAWNVGPPQESTVRGRGIVVLFWWWEMVSMLAFGRLNASLVQGAAAAVDDAAVIMVIALRGLGFMVLGLCRLTQ